MKLYKIKLYTILYNKLYGIIYVFDFEKNGNVGSNGYESSQQKPFLSIDSVNVKTMTFMC